MFKRSPACNKGIAVNAGLTGFASTAFYQLSCCYHRDGTLSAFVSNSSFVLYCAAVQADKALLPALQQYFNVSGNI
jgi:hypothetical protein